MKRTMKNQPQPNHGAAASQRGGRRSTINALLLAGSVAGGFTTHLRGDVITHYDVNRDIPDYSSSGLADQREVSGVLGPIAALRLTLQIVSSGSGAYNGDFYVTLTHDSGFAVLLNRPGVNATDSFGYGDAGIAVTFDSHAAGDIHNYRLVLEGNPDQALPGSLTGTWQPDGRTADPDFVLETSPRTAGLKSFNGLDPNGTWTLFAADLSPGGTAQLAGWGLEITATPEPSGLLSMLLIISGLAGCQLGRFLRTHAGRLCRSGKASSHAGTR